MFADLGIVSHQLLCKSDGWNQAWICDV